MGPRAAAAVVLGLVLLAGCGTDQDDESLLGPGGPGSSVPGASAPTSGPSTPDDRPRTTDELLTAYAEAVLDHDPAGFDALVDTGADGRDAAFTAQQQRLYANLQRLPVRALRFRVVGDHVERTLELGSYDALPVVGPAGFAVATRDGRAVVVPDQEHPATDPWDLAEVRAATDGGALVVTGVALADRLPDLLVATRAAIVADQQVVPLSWSHTAVVYAFRDPAVTASYSMVPGGNPRHLGALTFPVRGASGERAGSRVVVLPAALDAPDPELRRVLRHEVTHVALGERDDDAPTWLGEGLAEYVAARATPAQDRRIATVAVQAAGADAIEVPADFTSGDQTLHYAESWQACEYLASARGPQVLWDLLDAMDRAEVGRDGSGGPGQDAVLEQVAGTDTTDLASRTAALIRSTYG